LNFVRILFFKFSRGFFCGVWQGGSGHRRAGVFNRSRWISQEATE
jgi:hypothetical protein